MDERLQFVARRLAGEPMSDLCREFGISRKTGYKIFDRYQQCGVQGLTDRSRRPYRYAHRPSPRPATSCSSKPGSITSWRFSITSAPMKPWA